MNDLSLEDAITIALKNNAGLKASSLEIQRSQELVNGAYNIDKTNFYLGYDQNNIAD